MKKLFGKNIEPSCIYCENAKKDSAKEVFCAKKMKYIREDMAKGIKCRNYKYNPYEREPRSKTFKIPKYEQKEFHI